MVPLAAVSAPAIAACAAVALIVHVALCLAVARRAGDNGESFWGFFALGLVTTALVSAVAAGYRTGRRRS